MRNKLKRDNSIYKTGNKEMYKTYDFQKFKTIRSFGSKIYNNDLSMNDVLELQIRLKNNTNIFKESTKANGRQKVLNALESGIFPNRK